MLITSAGMTGVPVMTQTSIMKNHGVTIPDRFRAEGLMMLEISEHLTTGIILTLTITPTTTHRGFGVFTDLFTGLVSSILSIPTWGFIILFS
jgi:hypothetical protein